jgi:hypothetical protein
MNISKYLLSGVFLFFSTIANAQGLSINNQGILVGAPIHKTATATYYRCEDVVSDYQFIQTAYQILSNISDTTGIPAPQSSNCVVEQSFAFGGNSISLLFFVDAQNSRCFYDNFCNDTRSATILPRGSVLTVQFTVINAATTTTEHWCFTATNGLVARHCNS